MCFVAAVESLAEVGSAVVASDVVAAAAAVILEAALQEVEACRASATSAAESTAAWPTAVGETPSGVGGCQWAPVYHSLSRSGRLLCGRRLSLRYTTGAGYCIW